MLRTDKKNKFDEEVDEMGVRILIDPGALMHVVGTKMDFVEDRLKYAHSPCLTLQASLYKTMESFTWFSLVPGVCPHLCSHPLRKTNERTRAPSS